MRQIPINFLALLVAAVAKMVIGAVWYSPPLFLRPWRRLTGITEQQMKEGMARRSSWTSSAVFSWRSSWFMPSAMLGP